MQKCRGIRRKKSQEDIEKFEREWLLGRPDLILPKKFTLCVPERLQGRDEWERAKSFFVSRWHIPVEEWDRNILDPWLREQPDIVADLFGDAFAETYCRQDNWNDGRFRPLLSGSGDGRIDRFLSLREDRAIVIPEAFREKFSEVLGGSSTVLIEGLPGVGKTTTALALGSAAGRRVFFVGIDDGIDENALFEGVKRRCARETTFVIDDCQNNWSLVARAMRRWRRALGGRDYRLVLTAQTAPEGTETYDLGAIDLLTALRDDGVSIEVVADETLFRSVLAKRKSALAFAPDDEIVYLYGLTGGSLAVLDLIVESGVETIPRDATIESIAPKLVGHWFPTESPTAPRLRDFAAVAQFDIAIPALASWPEPEGSRYRSAIRRLVGRFADARRGVPPSWRFLHPAAAESIFRALCAVALEDWHIESVRAVVEHFRERAQQDSRFNSDLDRFLGNRLRLSNDAEFKATVLAAEDFREAVRARVASLSLLRLSHMTFLTRGNREGRVYAAWVLGRLRQILADPAGADSDELAALGYALRTVGSVDPAGAAQLEVPTLQLIGASRTILELFRILQQTTPGFAAGLIDALDAATVSDLVDKTIAAERPIGTLSLAFRELRDRRMPDGRGQLEALEDLLGSAPTLRLIRARGTIFELFTILQHTTPGFAAGLIDALDGATVSDLVDKTIAAERSIGTLHLALRELDDRRMPDGRSQLEALQGLLGGAPTLKLVRARGTFFELFRILQYTTPGFAAGLIDALDAATVFDLVDKTIAAERSIGTLNFTFRELSDRRMPDGRSQLEALETVVGVNEFWRLVEGAGDLNDLAYLLPHVTPEFRQSALSCPPTADASRWGALIRRGDVYCLARFARDGAAFLPPDTLRTFLAAAYAETRALARKSSWACLAMALAMCDGIASIATRELIQSETLARIGDVELGAARFDGLLEAASALKLLWRHRVELRGDIAAGFYGLLPPRSEWPDDHKLVVAAGILLEICRDSLMGRETATSMMQAFAPSLPAKAISKASAQSLWMFIWNFSACQTAWNRENIRSLMSFWNVATQDRIFARLQSLAQKARSDEERLAALTLAGTIAYLAPEARNRSDFSVRGKVRGFPRLKDKAEDLTFVPAALASIGLSLIGPPRVVFEAARVERIVAKAAEYEDQGPSVKRLVQSLRDLTRPSARR